MTDSNITKPPKKTPKPRSIVPTIRQRRAAKIMADNVSQTLQKSTGDVLREAGYDEGTATHPQYVTESKGYKAELAKYGLTEELITSALVEDIEMKPQRRVQELSLAADILNMRKRQESEKTTINIAVFTEEQQRRIAARIIQQ